MKISHTPRLNTLPSDTPDGAIHVELYLTASLTLALVSCGGGGGYSSPAAPPAAPAAPLISGLLYGFPPGSAPAGFPNALVAVEDASTNAPITNATVTVNGVTLQYNSAPNNLEYEGTVPVDPGAAVALSVTVGGQTYTASGNEPTTYPSISAPAAGAAWAENSANAVSWTPGAPLTNAAYRIGVVNGALPAGSPVYFQTAASSVNSTVIPDNTLSQMTPGSEYVIVGLTLPVPVANAATGSSFVPGGYSAVPITLSTVMPVTPNAWTPRTFGGGHMNGVAWSGTQFVAVGYTNIGTGISNTGIIYTSPDGVTWTPRPVASGILRDIAWSGTTFAAVGNTGVVVTSPDGISWMTRASAAGSNLSGVVWAGTQFVAVGAAGTILTSPDGSTWTVQASGTTSDLTDIAWSGTKLVAVGLSGTVLTSPDGITWASQTSGTTANLTAVASSGTQFVAVGLSGTVLSSPDGITWTTQTMGTPYNVFGVDWTGSQFIAVGFFGGIYTSPDGATWKPQMSGSVASLSGVAASPATTVVVGLDTILTSP